MVSNHQSAWETIFLMTLAEQTCPVMKKDLLFIPLFGWTIALLKPITINRAQARDAIRLVLASGRSKLESRQVVLIFPEGTRMPEGVLGKYSSSGFKLATENRVPILPLVHNSAVCWPNNNWQKKPGVIQVVIGEPINSSGKDYRQLTDEVYHWSQKAFEELNAE